MSYPRPEDYDAEEPEAAELVMEVSKEDGVLKPPEKMAEVLIDFLEEKGYLKA